MATAVSDSAETDEYYATQAALGALVAAEIRELWPMLDPADILATFPGLRAGAAATGAQHALAAVSLAADYYEDHRLAQGVTTPFRMPIIPAPVMQQFEAYIDKTAAELLASIDAIVDEIYLGEVATQLQAEIEGSAAKLVADAGRNELLEAIEADREAKGWARVTRPGACSFCRMLATRGPVYTRESVTFRAHVPINGRGGTCQCTAEPLFAKHYEPPAHTRADMALWEQVSDDGFEGADARNEFRRRVEGREDGPRRPRTQKSSPEKPAAARSQQLGFDRLTASQLEHQLTVLEALPDSAYRSKQLDRVRTRLAELGA